MPGLLPSINENCFTSLDTNDYPPLEPFVSEFNQALDNLTTASQELDKSLIDKGLKESNSEPLHLKDISSEKIAQWQKLCVGEYESLLDSVQNLEQAYVAFKQLKLNLGSAINSKNKEISLENQLEELSTSLIESYPDLQETINYLKENFPQSSYDKLKTINNYLQAIEYDEQKKLLAELERNFNQEMNSLFLSEFKTMPQSFTTKIEANIKKYHAYEAWRENSSILLRSIAFSFALIPLYVLLPFLGIAFIIRERGSPEAILTSAFTTAVIGVLFSTIPIITLSVLLGPAFMIPLAATVAVSLSISLGAFALSHFIDNVLARKEKNLSLLVNDEQKVIDPQKTKDNSKLQFFTPARKEPAKEPQLSQVINNISQFFTRKKEHVNTEQHKKEIQQAFL